jgi:triacylglycerol lipase
MPLHFHIHVSNRRKIQSFLGEITCRASDMSVLWLIMNIVLMHGVLGFRRIGGVDYFNSVANRLRAVFPRAKVLPTEVPPLGTVPKRAAVAAEQIANDTERVLEADKPLHIIAHSMGGLDARHLASNDLQGLRKRIRTVICIATPHRGSPVAEFLNFGNPFAAFGPLHADGGLLKELRDHADAVRDLSISEAMKFDKTCHDVPSIHYFDVAGVGRDAVVPTSAFFYPFHVFMLGAGFGQNDGMVPSSSAVRGRTPAAVWRGDHADMVGHDLNGPTAESKPPLDYESEYVTLVRELILKNQ